MGSYQTRKLGVGVRVVDRPSQAGGSKIQGTSFKLYHDAGLRSVRVKWILHELVEDRFEVEYVDIYGAQQYSPQYLTINPNHAVPVLTIAREDGSSMHMLESAAMVALLADAFPEKGLAPSPGLSFSRADYLQVRLRVQRAWSR